MTCIVCPIVIMSFSRLHSVMEMVTNGRWRRGCMNRVSCVWGVLNCVVISLVKCLDCLD